MDISQRELQKFNILLKKIKIYYFKLLNRGSREIAEDHPKKEY